MAPGDYDPTARRSLPAAWAQRWTAEPAREVLHDPARGWVSAGWLEEASRRAAGRFAAAGLTPGDRVLFSTGSSIDLVVAYVAALRSGLVPVPTNTAYTEREVAHVVGDARPRAAVVDDEARAGWIRTADAEVVITGPDVDLADGPEPTLDDPEPAAPA